MTAFEDAEFWEYITVDENGNMIGIQENMPKSAWKDYEAFLEEQRYAEEHNMKI